MKFTIHADLWTSRWTDGIALILRTVVDIGFDGVGISLFGMTENTTKALTRRLRDHGPAMNCWDGHSLASAITFDVPDTSAQRSRVWAVRSEQSRCRAAQGFRVLRGGGQFRFHRRR
jgi:hypothetical protein